MLELFVLLVAALSLGGLILLGLLVMLPFYLLFRLLGLALKVTFGGLLAVLLGIVLLPIALLVGALLLVKLLVVGLPLLLLGVAVVWLLGFLRQPAAA